MSAGSFTSLSSFLGQGEGTLGNAPNNTGSVEHTQRSQWDATGGPHSLNSHRSHLSLLETSRGTCGCTRNGFEAIYCLHIYITRSSTNIHPYAHPHNVYVRTYA